MSARHEAVGKVSNEQRRVERLFTRQEALLRGAFFAFLIAARSESIFRRARRLIAENRNLELLTLIDGHVERLASILPRIFAKVGEDEVEALAVQLKIRPKVAKRDLPVDIVFDPTHPVAAEAMRQSRLRFVREFSAGQQLATREALSQALIDGSGPRQAARGFRDSIGLTTRQSAAVANYERLLREGNADALSRDLRDRRFDPSVRRAIEAGQPLEPEQISRMVARYRERFLVYRAETIARTETLRVLSEAREEALRQMLEQTGISADLVERKWNATKDLRTRDTHRGMDGQRVTGQTTPFISPSGAQLRYPGDRNAPGAETINCRCVVTTRIKQEGES